MAVWATLGQVAVEGTAYTSGAETVFKPTDTAKLRVYNAVVAVLQSASSGGGSSSVGMNIRSGEGSTTDTVDLGSDLSLSKAAEDGTDGIKTETIGGKQYYTREFILTCTSMPDSGSVTLQISGAPAGTVLSNASNQVLAGGAVTLTASGTEYTGKFKICVPADATEAGTAGSVTVQAAASIASCTFYKVENSHAYEQDFIIADPNSATSSAAGYLKWGESGTTVPDTGSIRLLKTGETGEALAGAEFDIDGSGGYHASGTTGEDGSITWNDLPTGQGYTITETVAPEGFQLAEPISVTAKAGQTVYITVTDDSQRVFRVHKQDKQSGFSLEGAVFLFEQIDGDFVIEGRTRADGLIEYTPDKLPYGSYRVSELSAPEGYEKDSMVKTVNWDGKADIDLYFTNVRKPGFRILKVDSVTNMPLSGAYFDIYKDGALIDTVRSNEQGIATISGISKGYYECVEKIAPYGYVLSTERYGIRIDPFDPATSEDPIIRVPNRRMPALRIVKYDAQTMQPIPNVTFEVYNDTKRMGQYTTDSRGEIYLYDLEPGTYTAQEIAVPDSHVINTTPQSIELESGVTQTYNLIFFNYLKPGIHLRKVDSQTMLPLLNAKYRITQVGGTFSQEYTTDENGEIDLTGLDPGSYTVVELSAPDGYLIDDAERIIKIEGGDNAEFLFTNTKKPVLRLVKLDSLTGERLPGATYRIAKIADGSHYLDRVTDINGEITITDLEPGVYSAQEMMAPEGYVLDQTEFHVELFPGQTSQLVVSDDVKPDLRIVKKDADTGAYLEGAVFKVKAADGATLTAEETNEKGEIILQGLDPGVYEISEQTPPAGYLPARQSSQLITLTANKLGTVIFTNYEKPTLTVNKISSVSAEPLKGAKFQVTYRSNNTETGSMRNLGNYLTDDNGQFKLTDLTDGWYTITELESVPGYSIKEATQEVYIKGGEDKVLNFENVPLSALVVYKYDSVDGTAVSSARFQVKKLTDTSGTGGTVIGTYTTGPNGSFTVTGLAEGAYIVEELSSDSGHVIDSAPQTAYISGKQTDVVELYFGNSPKGSILVKKIDSVTHEPLSDVEFLVTDSEGTLIGNANGKYVTDSAGTILIDNLDPSITLVVKETKAKAGYVMDDVPQTVKVRAGHTVSLEFRNAPYGGLVILKIDEKTKEALSGAVFQITNSAGTYVDRYGNSVSGTGGADGTSGNGFASSNGRYETDVNGQIRLPALKPDTYVVSEVEAPEHYLLNAEPQTVRVNTNDTQTLTFGDPRKGTLVIQKRDSVTGAPLEGVTMLVKTSSGEYVTNNGGLTSSNGEYVTDANGQITLTDLMPDTYIVTESATVSGYVLDTTARSIVVRANDTQTLTVTNRPKGSLVVQKVDSITREPLANAEFRITTSDGTLVDGNEGLTSSTGLYTTDENGQIYLTKLTPATYVITETRAPDNYKLAATARTIVVRAADTQTVTVTDDPLCTLTVLKRDASTKEPLRGAEFLVKYSDGTVVGPNNGRYTTGSDGTVTVSGLKPDATVVVTEQKAPTGYLKDDEAQSIVVRSGVANSLTFDDEPTTTLVIHKYISGSDYEPLAGVGFKVTDGNGGDVGPDAGIYYTDKSGEIVLSGLEPGMSVTVREISTVDGFVLDGTPQRILIQSGTVQNLTFWNQRQGSLTVRKLDSVSKEPLEGATFKITYADGRPVDTENGQVSSRGIYTTNCNGEINITGITGTILITEEHAPEGYSILTNCKTKAVTVNPDDGQTVIFYNDPHQTLVIEKYIKDTTTPIANARFLVTDSSGAVIGQENGEFTTDEYGRITISNLEVGTTVTAREIFVPEGFVLDSTPKSIKIQQGEAQRMTFYDAPKQVVVIQKYVSGSTVPIEGVTFLVTDANHQPIGSSSGEHVTDGTGRVILSVDPGTTVVAREIRTVSGYVLNSTPQTIEVKSGEVNALTFYDDVLSTLVIHKYASGTVNEPIANVAFEVRDGSGAALNPDGGIYYTNEAGEIVLDNLEPGLVLTVREVKTVEGYVLNGIPQTIEIASGSVQNLTFWNQKAGSLLIRKLDSVSLAPLAGVEFSVRYADGTPVDTANGQISSNGRYWTNSNGEILITGVTGTIVVTEEKTIAGYTMNEHDRTQAVVVNPEDGQTLVFYNDSNQTLVIEKYVVDSTVPVPNTKFLVTDSGGEFIGPNKGEYVTDENGRVVIGNLEPGKTITVKEIQAADGFVYDGTPQNIKIVQGEVQTLKFYDTPKQLLVVQKYVDGTTTPIQGVKFLLTDGSGNPIGDGNGEFVTDSTGRITVSNLNPGTTVVAKEIRAGTGYALNGEAQSIEIKAGTLNALTFYDEPLGVLVINKYIQGTEREPLPGVAFEVTDGSGAKIGPDNGIYYTDKQGQIRLENLELGATLTVKEVATVEGFVLDGTPQQVKIHSGEQNLTFWNQRRGSLTIRKLDSVTKQPLVGVTFKITYADGRFVDNANGHISSNGMYQTDKNGEITISGVTGTLVVTEERTIEGYTIDEGARTQTVTVNPDDGQVLTFYNTPVGGVELIKVNAAKTSERIPGTTFEIRRMDDALVDTVTTDKNGRVFVSLDEGSYYAVEIAAAEGFKLDPTPTYFEVKAGKTTTKTITNEKFSGITIHKIDSVTRQGIYGVTFVLYDSGKTPIEQMTTDQYGYARTSKELKAGQYFLRELEAAEGYITDIQYKTVFVEAGKSTTIEWENTPITAQIQLTKYAAENNTVTGQAKGSTLQGAVYEIVRERSGVVVATITTNARGVAASPALPLGRYLVREVTAPTYWQLSEQTFDVTLEYPGQILKLADYDKPAELGVTITKTGNASVMSGSAMTYKISVANTSNVPLESYYWHDRIPTDVATATTLTTGTYSARLNYRILYRTNYNQTYQVLASNLITTNNYSFSLNAIPTQQDEKVTDVYFEFGKVPVGFQSVTGPTLSVVVNGDAANGYQMINRADVGGKYGETWQTAQAGWVTGIVNLNKDPVLPKTGY